MDVRRLCNVAYAYLAVGRDSDELAKLDGILDGTLAVNEKKPVVPGMPERPAVPDQAGTRAVMAAMMLPQKA